MIINLTVVLVRKVEWYKMNQCLPQPYERSSGNVKVELDLCNYTERADLNEVTVVDAYNLASKSNLASLKAEADKVKIVLADLSNLNNVVDNDVVKKLIMINWSQKLIILMLLILIN